jgi:hypothetical protein
MTAEGFELGRVQGASGDPGAYVDSVTGFEIRLPKTWVGAGLLGGATNVGDRMFPDDPGKAARAQEAFGGLPSRNVFVGTLAEEFGGPDSMIVNVVVLPATDGKASYDQLVSASEELIRSSGATNFGDDLIPFLGGDGVRIHFDQPGDSSGLIYAGVVGHRGWGLLAVGPKRVLESRSKEIDTIAASFRVTAP